MREQATTIIKLSQYADDTAITAFNYVGNYDTLELDINEYLGELCDYFSKWRIKLNKNKTERLTFVGSYKVTKYIDRKKARNVEISIDNQIIVNSDQVKYLGLILTPNLEYYRHIDHVIRKVDIAFAKLKNIFASKIIESSVKVLAYKTLIRPIITYACANYFQTSSYQIERIRKKERKILRYCYNSFRSNRNKYVNSRVLYENIDRIDIYCTKMNIGIIEKILINANMKPYSNWKHILNGYEEAINAHHKLPIHLWALNDLGQLYEPDGNLLFFNRAKNSNNSVYITTQ